MTDPTCPYSVLTFTAAPNVDSKPLDAQLQAELAAHSYAHVLVTFVGTVNPVSKVDDASIWLRCKLGAQLERKKDLTILKIISTNIADRTD